ncbi:MAG: beta-lactamase family protein [Acidobacteria bacterium]|nr:beta-lactamase family protein [Acidobacteriota bacterium]
MPLIDNLRVMRLSPGRSIPALCRSLCGARKTEGQNFMKTWSNVVSILLLAGLCCQGVIAQHPNETVAGELGDKLDAHLIRATSNGFSGTVLVVKDGQVILSKGYGLANRERKIPVTPDTIFDIGSLVKQFTAAAILKLEMKGKLRITDPISKYFKNVPPDKATMTLHHLLTHTAGFPDAIGDDYEVISRDEYIKRALNTMLLSAPGEKYKYSNVDYSLLGAIVEMRSGQDYEHYIYNNLFKPAGMSLTGYRIPKWNPDAIAHNYIGNSDWGTGLSKRWAADGPYWNLRANGGMLFTIGDMYKWMQALAGERVLPKEVKQKYFTPYVKTPSLPGLDWFYGYGWRIANTPRNTKIIWHGGDGDAFHSDASWFIDEKVIIIMATNVAEYKASIVSRQLADIIFSKA